MKRKQFPAFVLITSLVALSAVVGAAAATELARINGKVITLEEFNRKYQEDQKVLQNRSRTKQAVLDDLVKRELVIQEGRRLGLDRDPDVIERMNTVLFYAVIDKALTKQFEAINISDEEAKAYYDKNPEIRTSHIFVAVPPGASAEEQKQALERIRKIQSEQVRPGKMSFAEIAQRFSDGPAAPMGGDIDYQTRFGLDENYYNASIRLKQGEVSDVVRTPFGYHLIKKTAQRSWEDADKNKVRRMVFEEKKNQLFEKFVVGLRQKAKVTTNSALLVK